MLLKLPLFIHQLDLIKCIQKVFEFEIFTKDQLSTSHISSIFSK